MAKPPLTKNEFLELVANQFLVDHAAWRLSYRNKRAYWLTVGREIEQYCFLWLLFSCRPDRYWFGLSVGWSPSEEALVKRLEARENPPIYPNDGSLRRIRTLEHVRQFQLHEMSRSVSGLYVPYQNYDLETTPSEQLAALMLTEIREYAFPYLRLMLTARHSVNLTDEELGGGAVA